MESKKKKDKEERLKDYVKKVTDWYTYANEHIERARNTQTFLYVDQWEPEVRAHREDRGMPTMTFNKLTTIVRSVLGDRRDNSPSLAVRGVGEDIDQKTVDIYEGIIRKNEYDSDADVIYQLAGKHGLEVGWGAARVVIEYENERSMDRCLRLKLIPNIQAAFFDPTAQEPDKSDGDYVGVTSIMSLEKFEALGYKVENPQSVVGSINNYYFSWNTRETITIAELYIKEYYTKTLVQLSDGEMYDEDEALERMEKQKQEVENNPFADIEGIAALEIVNEREVRDYKIKHVKFVQNKILEETDYPGKILPIVYFVGDSTNIDGEEIPISFVQEAIDTQKLINYEGSEMAYGILRSRKEMVMGTTKNFEGFETDWENPDRVQGFLNYNWDKEAGKPEVISPPPFNPALMQAYNNSTNDLSQILGMYDEARGNETNAISGLAVNKRQEASTKSVKVYNNNWKRGIRQLGKIQIELIPHVYDTERNVTIMGADGETRSVRVNKQRGFNMLPNGDVEPYIEHDLTKGKYDIEVQVDGSWDSQRAEALDMLLRLATLSPAMPNLIADLVAEVSGLENTQKLVERLKTLVPPQILAKEEGKPMPPPAPEQPNPELMIQSQKNQLAMQANQLKAKQQILDEQRLMQEAQIAGIEAKGTFAKAAAEIHKSNQQKDIAILNHGNTMRG